MVTVKSELRWLFYFEISKVVLISLDRSFPGQLWTRQSFLTELWRLYFQKEI